MSLELATPGVGELGGVVRALREWQYEGGPAQLHPGDVGWNWSLGAKATAAAVRTWSRDGLILAVGLMDSPRLVRLGMAPDAGGDGELIHHMVLDLSDPERGVLPQGEVAVEARFGGRICESLVAEG